MASALYNKKAAQTSDGFDDSVFRYLILFTNLNSLSDPFGIGVAPASHRHNVDTETSTCLEACARDSLSFLRKLLSSAPVMRDS